MKQHLLSLCCESDGAWAGVFLPHLLGLHLEEGRGAASAPDLLEIYFSTHLIRVEGTRLRFLWAALIAGTPTEDEEKATGYRVSHIEPRLYKDAPDAQQPSDQQATAPAP